MFTFDCKEPLPGLNIPMVMDNTGAYFRREGLGGRYITGKSPSKEEEPPTDNLEVDYSYFDKVLWPILAQRVPAFNAIKVYQILIKHSLYNMINLILGLENRPFSKY